MSRKFAGSRRDSNRTFQSRSLRSCGIESIVSEAEWRKELKGDRDGGKSQEKYMNEEERKISRLLNYRDIIKSISLFTTPTTVFRYYPGMDDSLRLSHDLLSDFHDFSDPSIVNFDHQISSQI